MQKIRSYSLVIILGLWFPVLVHAAENNNFETAEIDMTQLEEYYQEQHVMEEPVQYQDNQNINVQQEQSLHNEDIRARRLREWQEQHQQQPQPVAMQHSALNQNRAPEPEADDLFAAATNGNTAKLGALLAQGLDINTPNAERETALHMAAARGHYSTVIYLLNKGAYANARTVKHWIPLHHAVRFRHYNIANYLVKHGSSPRVRTSDGKSAIDMARGVSDYRLLSILGAR